MRFQIATVLLASGASFVSAKVSYEGAKAIRIPVGEDVDTLRNLIVDFSLPTWKGMKAGIIKPNTDVDLVVPADRLQDFLNATATMNTEVMHENLGLSIADEGNMNAYEAGSANISWFNSYHPYNDHLQWLSDMVALYPSNAAIVTAGVSEEGRPITGIHFYGTEALGSKPAVIIHSTVHAREWVTTLATEYFVWNLLSNYSSNAEIKGFVDKYDYYVFPVVNPDGFIYTQTTDRLWRKNRQANTGATCLGRDINRNWPYKWEVTGGASTNACAEDFKGAAAGDATENKVLSAFVNKIAAAQGVQLFIDVHSYSQLFMTPFGYSCTAAETKSNNVLLQAMAKGVAAAIKSVYGTTFEYGPICSTIYPATGNAVDYVSEVSKSKYTFTIELRDTGRNGFVLPANQILPTGLETWAGFRYLLLNMT